MARKPAAPKWEKPTLPIPETDQPAWSSRRPRLSLPIPQSLNRIYRRNPKGTGMYLTPEGEAYKRLIAEEVHAYMVREGLPSSGADVVVRAWIFWPNAARKRDAGNREKLLMDAFNRLLWGDDHQAWYQPQPPHQYDPENPRIELEFAEYDPRQDTPPAFAGYTSQRLADYARQEIEAAASRKQAGIEKARKTRITKKLQETGTLPALPATRRKAHPALTAGGLKSPAAPPKRTRRPSKKRTDQ